MKGNETFTYSKYRYVLRNAIIGLLFIDIQTGTG